MVKKLPAF